MEDKHPSELKSMTFGEHLEELRLRIILCLASVVAGAILCWFLYDRILVNLMKAPLDMVAGRYNNPFAFRNPVLELLRSRLDLNPVRIGNLNAFNILEPLMVRLKVCFWGGLVLSSPFVIGQIWRFVGTGLYPDEKRSVRIYGAASLLLFLLGCSFAFFIVLPIVIAVLLGSSTQFSIVLRLNEYFSDVMIAVIGLGLIFELPLVIMFLASIGVVNSKTLSRRRRHVILATVIFAAVITPTVDPFTQLLVAVPILLLYEASILLLRLKRC